MDEVACDLSSESQSNATTKMQKGCVTKEATVEKNESYEDDIKILHRMIAYLRDEADRLRIVEVVRLME